MFNKTMETRETLLRAGFVEVSNLDILLLTPDGKILIRTDKTAKDVSDEADEAVDAALVEHGIDMHFAARNIAVTVFKSAK